MYGCKTPQKRYALVQYFWRLQLELLGDVMLHLREFLVILVMLLASSYAESWAKKGNQGDWEITTCECSNFDPPLWSNPVCTPHFLHSWAKLEVVKKPGYIMFLSPVNVLFRSCRKKGLDSRDLRFPHFLFLLRRRRRRRFRLRFAIAAASVVIWP